MKIYYPERIICLTEETTETLYLLGEQDRIIGVSGFTVRPAIARKDKPKISTFIDAKIDKICDLKPDLVIGFSDIQGNIAKELIEKGIPVWINNYRSVQGIKKMIFQLGVLVGRKQESLQLIQQINDQIDSIIKKVEKWENHPKVYFEEWDDPMISGIKWVSEIIQIAGGIDIFPELQNESLAKNRIIHDPDLVVKRNPDIIIASWCGKKFKKDIMVERYGWKDINGVINDKIYEIKSEIILQPGPASVIDGLKIIHNLINDWYNN